MWIGDLTKALYFLNATEYKYTVCIEKIENNFIYFSNHKCWSVQALAVAYEHFIYNGEIMELW